MTRPTRREGVLCLVLACLGVAFVILVPGCGPRDSQSSGAGSGPVDDPATFTISGDIAEPIVPGGEESLDLSLANPDDVDLVVDRITVTITDVDAPQSDAGHPCTAADFDVRQPADGLTITLAANRIDDLSGLGVASGDWPAVGMVDRPVNQDGCKGATLTLGYEARGVEVRA